MESFLNRMAEKASKTVRHWWLYLLTGILSIIAGIVVFCYPIESYLTLSIMFGVQLQHSRRHPRPAYGSVPVLLPARNPRRTASSTWCVDDVPQFHDYRSGQRYGLLPRPRQRLGNCGRRGTPAPLTGHHILPPDARNSLCGHSHRLCPDRIRHHAYSPEHTSAPHPRALPLPRCRDSRLRL